MFDPKNPMGMNWGSVRNVGPAPQEAVPTGVGQAQTPKPATMPGTPVMSPEAKARERLGVNPQAQAAENTETPQAPSIRPDQSAYDNSFMGMPLKSSGGISEQKQRNVAGAAQEKMASLGQDDRERAVIAKQSGTQELLDEPTQDAMRMSITDYTQKYGSGAADRWMQLQGAEHKIKLDQSVDRSGGDAFTDTMISAGKGAAQSVMTLGQIPTALASKEAGVGLAQATQDVGEWFDGKRSTKSKVSDKYGNIEDALDTEVNKKEYDQAIADGDNPIVAKLARVGKDVAKVAGNVLSDPTRAGNLISEGIGDLALSFGGGAIAAKLGAKAVASGVSAQGMKKLQSYTTAAYISGSEAGDAYGGAALEVMGMSETELKEKSESYNKLRENMTHEEAQIELANESGMIAAAITAPGSFLAGKAVSKFQTNPLGFGAAVGAKAKAKDIAKTTATQTLEEGFQEGLASGSGNIGVKASGADPKKDLLEGVGQSVAMGAVAGGGMAAAVRTPGAAIDSAAKVIGIGADAAVEAVKQPEKKAKAAVVVANEQGATIDAAIAKVAAQPLTEEQSKNKVDPEKQAADVQSAGKTIQRIFTFDEKGPEIGDMSEELAEVVWPAASGDAGKGQKLSGLVNLAETLGKGTLSKEAQEEGVLYLQSEFKFLSDLVNGGLSETEKQILAANGDASKNIAEVVNAIGKSKAMQKAFQATLSEEMVNRVTTVTPESTPDEVGKALRATLQAGSLDPMKINAANTKMILDHAKRGTIKLSEKETSELDFTASTKQAISDFDTKLGTNIHPNQRKMRERLLYGRSGVKNDPSLLGLVSSINAAVRSGNIEEAQRQMTKFAFFREGQKQKLAAMEAAKATNDGSKHKYSVLQPQGWVKDFESVYYAKDNANSEQHFKIIGSEYELINSVYEKLKALHPEAVKAGIAKASDVATVGKLGSKSERAAPVTVPEGTGPTALVDDAVVPRNAAGRGFKKNKNAVPNKLHFNEDGSLKPAVNPVKLPPKYKKARGHEVKDTYRASVATKLIAKGQGESWTKRYADAYGDRANSGEYNSEDVVFISMDRSSQKLGTIGQFDRAEVMKAVRAGATIVMDDFAERQGKNSKGELTDNNAGAKELFEFLVDHGYVVQSGKGAVMVPMTSVKMDPSMFQTDKSEPVKKPAGINRAKPTPEQLADLKKEMSSQEAQELADESKEQDWQTKARKLDAQWKKKGREPKETGKPLVEGELPLHLQAGIALKLADALSGSKLIPVAGFTDGELSAMKGAFGINPKGKAFRPTQAISTFLAEFLSSYDGPDETQKPPPKPKPPVKLIGGEDLTPDKGYEFVTDTKDGPINFYHGTKEEFDDFADGATFWTSRVGLAREFGMSRKEDTPTRVVKAKIQVKNPAFIDAGSETELSVWTQQNSEQYKDLLKQGRDAIVIYNDDGEMLVISTEGKQVKTIGVETAAGNRKPVVTPPVSTEEVKPAIQTSKGTGTDLVQPTRRTSNNPNPNTEADNALISKVVPYSNITAPFYENYGVSKKGSLFHVGSGTPVSKVMNALWDLFPSDREDGENPMMVFWQNKIETLVPQITKAMNEKLQDTLTPDTIAKLEAGYLSKDGAVFGEFTSYKHLNFIEKGPDGNYRYIPEVAQIAALSLVQFIISEKPPIKGIREPKDAMSVFDVSDIDLVNDEMLIALETGTYHQQATVRLADIIQKFMGVKPHNDMSQSMAGGMLLGLAAEVMATATQDQSWNLMIENSEPVIEKKATNRLPLLNRLTIFVPVEKLNSFVDQEDDFDLFERSETPKGLGKPLDVASREFVVVTVTDPTIVGDDDNASWTEQSHGFPDAMLEAITPDAEKPVYVGTPPKAEDDSRTQLRNSQTPLSKKELIANRNAQEKVHKLNVPLLRVTLALGDRVFKNIMGFDFDADFAHKNPKAITRKKYNSKNLGRIVGQNTSIMTGLRAIEGFYKQGMAWGAAQENPTDLGDVPFYMGTDTTVVGRQQERGTGPVSSKEVRQFLTPTFALMNMNTAKDANGFWMAVAQAWGMKTEQRYRADLVNSVQEAMKDERTAAVIEFLKQTMYALDQEEDYTLTTQQKEYFEKLIAPREDGKPFFPDQPNKGYDALVHVARLQLAQEEGSGDELSSFPMTLALEADGKTDGPIHALWNFMASGLSGLNISLLEKGGFFLNKRNHSLNKLYMDNPKTDSSPGHKDLYAHGGAALEKIFDRNFPNLGLAQGSMKNLIELMSLLGDDFAYNEKEGTVTIMVGRGLIKNPLTVSVYGAGLDGISGKLVRLVMDKVYEHMSDLADTTNTSAALASDPIYKLVGAMVNENVVYSTKKDKWYTFPSEVGQMTNKTTMTPETFRMTGPQYKQFTNNMKLLMGQPMNEAIDEMMGDTRKTMKLFQAATQIQGKVIVDLFNQEIKKTIADRVASGQLRAGQELSQKDYNDILKRVAPYGATIHIGRDQTANMSAKERMEFDYKESSHNATSADRRFKGNLMQSGPGEVGVKVAPYITIMTGDGQMILRLGQDDSLGSDGRALFVFDGVEMAADMIDEYGLEINKQVAKGWETNYAKYMAQSFDKFMKTDFKGKLTDEAAEAINKLLEVNKMAGLTEIQDELWKASNMIEARKSVISRIPYSVDHMASAEQPYTNAVTKFLVDQYDKPLEGEALAIALNTMIFAKYAELEKQREKLVESKRQKEKTKLRNDKSFLTRLQSGAKNVTKTGSVFRTKAANLMPLLKDMIDPDQKSIFYAALKSIGKKDGYTYYFGSAEELTNLRNTHNPDSVDNGNIDLGQYDPNTRSVYIASGSQETVIHETIHIATADKLLAVLENPQAANQETRAAVERLNLLMNEFMGMNLNTNQDGLDAQATIEQYLQAYSYSQDPQHMAAALGEFMAWNLTNLSLIADMKRTRVVNPLARMAGKVMAAIKKILGLSNDATIISDSMYWNIRFNAELVITDKRKSPPKNSTLLNHSTRGDPRLTRLQDKFERIVDKHYSKLSEPVRTSERLGDSAKATKIAGTFMRNGFHFNMQKQNLFTLLQNAFVATINYDQQTLLEAKKVHQNFLKQVTVDDLMDDPVRNDPTDRTLANQRYNVLTGSTKVWGNLADVPHMLAAFMAAAQVDDNLRAFLERLEPVKDKPTKHVSDNTVDYLGGLGFDILAEKLDKMMFQSETDKTARDAVDSILNTVKVIDDQAGFQLMNLAENMDAKVNQYISEYSQTGLDTVLDKLREIEHDSSKSRGWQNTAFITRGFGSVFSKKHGLEFAELITTALNNKRVWTPVRDFFAELRGTTGSNERVHNLVNRVRALVAQSRQQFRDAIPHSIIQQFTRTLTQKEWAKVSNGMNTVDIGNLKNNYTFKQIKELYADPTKTAKEIDLILGELALLVPNKRDAKAMQRKAQSLAKFMMTGETDSTHILTNAHAIAQLLGEGRISVETNVDPRLEQTLDDLIGLSALQLMPSSDRKFITDLMESEPKGMEFIVELASQMDFAERHKTTNKVARNNYIKGKVDTVNVDTGSLVLAKDSSFPKLRKLSYAKVGDYHGDKQDEPMSYYYSPVNGQSTYHQGAMQTVQQTMYGVDTTTGFSVGGAGIALAGKAARAYHAELLQGRRDGLPDGEYLRPRFDEKGSVTAYERIMAPKHLALITKDENMTVRLGAWRGRQEEEKLSTMYNEELVNALFDIKNEDMGDESQYMNIADPDERDAVHDHIWKVIPDEMKAHIKQKFGMKGDKPYFPVRRDMLNDALGYPAPSIADMFHGKGRMPKNVQQAISNGLHTVFGDKAYGRLVMGERMIQTVVTAAKVTIVVKSGVVPLANIISNFYQLIMNGVPLRSFGRPLALKVKETNAYLSNRARQSEIETEMFAYKDKPNLLHRLEGEYQALQEANERMSIWPLIEKGEFNTITDGLSEADRVIHTSRIFDKIEEQMERLPAGIKDAAQYGYVSRNTKLFKLLNRSTQYGDFLSKALLYDHLKSKGNQSEEEAYKIVRNEFVNYNLLPGRSRGMLESIGLVWFWNFKIRSVKVAIRIIRDNPLKALLWSVAPIGVFNGIPGADDSVLSDNLIPKIWNGEIDRSMGPGMVNMILTGNPWHRIMS